MKRKNLSMILTLLLIFPLIASCTFGGNTENSSESGGSDTPDATSTVPGGDTSAEETTGSIRYEDVVPGDATQEYKEDVLGLTPYCARESHSCVKAEVRDGILRLTPFAYGYDVVSVFNDYGEEAQLIVKVFDERAMDVQVSPFEKPENSVTLDRSGGMDVTDALQSCVNEMHEKGSGTVYVPAGSYTIGTITMKDGVSLRFQGFVPDATVGYNKDVMAYAKASNMAVITSNGKSRSSFFFVNVDLPQQYCTEGHSDFLISGGLFNCKAQMKFIGMSCANNVIFENILVKDIPNNHAFQIEGCRDVLIDNLMFAGYNYPENNPVLTRETIQLEPTTPGAIGSDYANNVIQCNDGDYHHCHDVKIHGCYFGKSDLYGPQLVAVGHHSATGGLICDGFEFSDNVVDNPLYCGLHLPNYINVTISGNKFISTTKYGRAALATDSALISLYYFDKKQTYTDANGKTIVYAYNYEAPGDQNYDIFNNEFVLGGLTFLKAFRCYGLNTSDRNNAEYVNKSDLRVREYGGTPFAQNGFVVHTNCMYNINLHDNVFRITSKINATNNYIYLGNIIGFTFENNSFDVTKDMTFKSSWFDYTGIDATGLILGNSALTRKIVLSSKAVKTLSFMQEGKTVVMANPAKDTVYINLQPSENGRVELETDAVGNLEVLAIPDEGYVFDGWKKADGSYADLSVAPATGTIFTATFKKQ